MPRQRSPRAARIGQKLRDLRVEAGLGPTAFAAKVGQSSTYLNNIERGWNPVQPTHLDAYAAALGLTADKLRELLGFDEDDEELAAAS
jgi:transcriptional regulator with XRE-family HTH domain